MPYNLPNLLTWLRILAIPLFVGIFYFPHSWLSLTNQNLVATAIFAGAAITDWLDGYLARVLNQTSAFGAFLDPVADKLMVSAALIVLVYLGRLDAPIALIIIGREKIRVITENKDHADDLSVCGERQSCAVEQPHAGGVGQVFQHAVKFAHIQFGYFFFSQQRREITHKSRSNPMGGGDAPALSLFEGDQSRLSRQHFNGDT